MHSQIQVPITILENIIECVVITNFIITTFYLDNFEKTNIDVLTSKNQALCEYCTLVSQNIADTLIRLFPF